MTKKGKIVFALSVSTVAVLAVSVAVVAVVCKKIYEKKYFSAN